MRKVICLGILLVFSKSVFSQCSIKGNIIDSTKAPVPFATIALIRSQDSSIFKGAITDEIGNYCFSNIKSGNYLLKISTVGFSTKYSFLIKFDSSVSVTIPDIILTSQAKKLDEISITAIKSPIEFKDGNIIVNIEGSPLAVGNSAYDLLMHLPGVTVSNGNISIEGKEGVKIFIDDRAQQMSGQQLINLLRSINSSSIEKIEILKNPSVKYDASGTAGIINIKTKKIKITGFSGNANYTLSHGLDILHYAGFSLNYKAKKVALFSGVNFSGGKMEFEDNLSKTVTYNSTTTTLSQKSIEYDKSAIPVYNAGLDWYINSKNTVGLRIQGEYSEATRIKPGTTIVSDTSLGYDKMDYSRTVKNNWTYFNCNLNMEHLFDTNGTALRFSVDYYSPTIDYYVGEYQNHFYSNGIESSSPKIFKSNNTIDLKILASKLDFEKQLSKTLYLEAGIKGSYQKIISDYILQSKNNLTGVYTTDTTFTGNFSYEEKITAGYLNLKKEIRKFKLQVGVRGESTEVDAMSGVKAAKYADTYFGLFPVVSIDYKRSDNHVFQLAYSRRINRAPYTAFNPYKVFENILLSSTGNQYLLPEYVNKYNFTYTYKSKLSNSFSYTSMRDPHTWYSTQNDSTKETIIGIANLNSSYSLGYSLFLKVDIKKWWTFTFDGLMHYDSFSTKINNTEITKSKMAYEAYSNNLIALGSGFKMEVSGGYQSPRLARFLDFNQSRWWANMAIKKAFLKEKLTASIGIVDIFNTVNPHTSVNYSNQNWERYQGYDIRRLNIGLSYDFGKVRVEQREVNAADTEQQRRGK